MSETLKRLRYYANKPENELFGLYQNREILELIDAEAARADKYRLALVNINSIVNGDASQTGRLMSIAQIAEDALQ